MVVSVTECNWSLWLSLLLNGSNWSLWLSLLLNVTEVYVCLWHCKDLGKIWTETEMGWGRGGPGSLLADIFTFPAKSKCHQYWCASSDRGFHFKLQNLVFFGVCSRFVHSACKDFPPFFTGNSLNWQTNPSQETFQMTNKSFTGNKFQLTNKPFTGNKFKLTNPSSFTGNKFQLTNKSFIGNKFHLTNKYFTGNKFQLTNKSFKGTIKFQLTNKHLLKETSHTVSRHGN